MAGQRCGNGGSKPKHTIIGWKRSIGYSPTKLSNRQGIHVTKFVEGGCLCGASGFKAIAEVKFAIQCHCRDCQHISGGGNLPQIAVPSDNFEKQGLVEVYETMSDAGNTVKIAFCRRCGSPLYKSTSKMAETIFVCAGSLDEDLVKEPFHKVFEDCRRVWDS